jgi:hypothetical protein
VAGPQAVTKRVEITAAGLSPVLIVEPDLGGGTYTLICDGRRTSTRPEAFQATAATALAVLDEAELPRKAEQASRRILSAGIEFMQSCLEQSDSAWAASSFRGQGP